ncbi:electron transfer flavoprotein beta subunit [Janthinobacterium sp. CG_23.3]|uniref:electron transfer flavoprotein subunit beta/FixA family protein n=1 Tax=Janthinobacterium sp. CG_23.3 TaxID=3349634 RepID=UPI0038D4837C
MNDNLKIAVLLAPARHPLSARAQAGACDAAAFELACSLQPAEQLTLLCASVDGAIAAADLRPYAALGAANIELLAVAGDAALLPALAARLDGFDLVICGMRSEGQAASGLLAYRLAEALELPLASDVLEARRVGGALRVRQFLPKGLRRLLELDGPALLAVHARAPRTRQYAYARAAAGRIAHRAGAAGSILGGGGGGGGVGVGAVWSYEALTRRPRPLKAALAQSGHTRMLGAIGGDGAGKGGEVVKQGNAVEKAQVLLDYLRDHGLVNF